MSEHSLTRLRAYRKLLLRLLRARRKALKAKGKTLKKAGRRRLKKAGRRRLKQVRRRLNAQVAPRVAGDHKPSPPAEPPTRPDLPERTRADLPERSPLLTTGELPPATAWQSLLRIPDELLRRGHLDLVNALVREDCVLHDAEAHKAAYGQDGYKEYVTNIRRALPDMLVSVHDQEIQGDRMVTRYSVRSTHAGWLRGVKATGKRVTFGGRVETRFAGGRIAEQWNFYDVPSIERQLGATLGGRPRT